MFAVEQDVDDILFRLNGAVVEKDGRLPVEQDVDDILHRFALSCISQSSRCGTEDVLIEEAVEDRVLLGTGGKTMKISD